MAHSLSLAYAEFVPPVSMADIDLAIEKSARDELERWARAHLKKVPRVDTVVRRGITHEVICDLADEYHEPGRFVTFKAFEWTSGEGHHEAIRDILGLPKD